ncbi:hypothetical protein IFM58399_01728 [Aspergillus lentulus]|uniref:Uncharacterized protein n=1 Tax=Aspergillus lentulus TaxID=293939 RepID=A0ABQ1ASG8_ASPLE|nr:uncharacterized protein IFM58399_01728 [Aspergillus lentulus]GFF27556.1 hypothetical protein IFM58399_01728 [Aspergillus lentulus]GFF48339.1 hypothetical protein IFM62136_00996 [Aspergillus lentulus]GFF82508.1 hypothetical protein IFM47457_05829 [Aspergillus lentulus]GFF87186.1 hypothetical protein IFM60648_07962 [Aspergillus lentulus]GFG02948.1 hypothetical protein IFM61392_02556 [Aspergillus lentulus]
MAVASKMSEGGNEPQEDPISEELYQLERERQQAERDHDIRDIRSNRTRRQEEDAPWLRISVDERPNPYFSEQSSDFDLYSDREPNGSARERIPPPPTGPPPPYPYDEEVERSRGLSRGSNSNGETRSRRFWNRLRRPERRAPPVQDSVPRQIPRQTGQQAPTASDARDPPPYSRFEPSEQNHGDDDSDFEEVVAVVRALGRGHDRAFDEFCQLMNAGRAALRQESDQPAPAQDLADNDNDGDISQFQFVSTERRQESNQPAAAQNSADDDIYSDFSQYFQLVGFEQYREGNQPVAAQNPAGNDDDGDFSQYFQFVSIDRRPESNQPAAAQNLADNDIYSDFSQYFQLVGSEQHLESDHNQPGESAIEDLQGDPELPPYSPNEEYTGQLEVDPWDGQDPWDFYLAAIEAGQNPPEGQPRTFPDLLEVHDEWLRTIERNRAPVNRAAP